MFGILVQVHTTGDPLWEAEELLISRYTSLSSSALKFRTKKEAEAYADSEIRRFRLNAEVRRLNTTLPAADAWTVGACKQRNAAGRAG